MCGYLDSKYSYKTLLYVRRLRLTYVNILLLNAEVVCLDDR